MTRRIRAFEYEGARFIANTKKALLADEMGMFKTAQAIFAKALI